METNKKTQALSLGNLIPKKNVSAVERILMIAGGAFVLYKTLSKKESSTTKNTIGTAMLLRGISGYCPAYHAVNSFSEDSSHNINIKVNIVVNRPILQVYAFWRNLENLPKYMNHLESVTAIDDKTSEWVAKGPLGVGKLIWRASIVKEEKNKFLSWKSLPGATIDNIGKVAFKPRGQATELEVNISYRVPMGVVGENAVKLLNPYLKKMIKDDIENFNLIWNLDSSSKGKTIND